MRLLPPRGPAEAALLTGMANLVGMMPPWLLPDPAPEVAPDVDETVKGVTSSSDAALPKAKCDAILLTRDQSPSGCGLTAPLHEAIR